MHNALLLLKEIPAGKVTTYGELARVCGTSARAIGRIMAKNPDPVNYPCYKVVSSSGRLLGYSAKGGLRRKEELLKREGIKIANRAVAKEYFYFFKINRPNFLMSNFTKKVLTLCIIHKPFGDAQDKHPKILLGMKKKGFGEGRWNGFGGKVERGEGIRNAAKRELVEEAGITPKDISKAGVIEFEFKGNPEILQVHVFKATDFDGEPTESDEMRPKWFDVDKIPFSKMWPDDAHWLPHVLAGKKVKAKFWFDGFDKIVDKKIELA
ncbi:MAG: methylated-DNA--[protein]-cysteine S-methyltransferase [Candidatus Spechtbacterales bacterium]